MSKMNVIVLAAGQGNRFGGKENKIFAVIDSQAVFLRALQLFVNREDVAQTILVVGPHDMERMKSKFGPNLGFMGVKLVTGGAERHDSVAAGLAALAPEAEYVAIHDAARVCVAADWIETIFQAAMKSGAAVPVTPVTATLKRLNPDHTIGDTVSREGLHLAQTPQIFRKDLLVAAYERLTDPEAAKSLAPITDDAQVVAAAGHPITAVDGDPRNIKITTRADLSLAAAILKVLPQKALSRTGAFEEAKW